MQAPTVFALTVEDGFDARSMICAPSGQVSETSLKAVAELADALGLDKSDDTGSAPHCQFCVINVAAILPTAQLVDAAQEQHIRIIHTRFETRFAHAPQGPPLGLRAPPPYI